MTALSADIPVLQTDRLILREPRLSDLEAMTAFGASDRARFFGGPMQPWQVWATLTGAIGHWVLRGHGMWTVELKATGTPVGRVGIINHIDWPEPELGWHVYDGFEGQGLAHEAALAARDHAQGQQGLGPLISLIDPANTRSRRLAERLGAIVESTGEVRGTPCLIYRHPAGASVPRSLFVPEVA